jgi:hypothetical protein
MCWWEDMAMRGFTKQTDRVEIRSNSDGDVNVASRIEEILYRAGAGKLTVRSSSLFYIRQTNGQLPDGSKIVFYFEPEFCYALDVGMPRLAILSVPYQIPTEPDGLGYRTIGRGDGEFPQFDEATVWSGSGVTNLELLYPAAAGEILIGARDGVTEPQLAAALQGFVTDLTSIGFAYTAKVTAFDEERICRMIEAEVPQVKYAALNGKVRNNSGPWWVDRVL